MAGVLEGQDAPWLRWGERGRGQNPAQAAAEAVGSWCQAGKKQKTKHIHTGERRKERGKNERRRVRKEESWCGAGSEENVSQTNEQQTTSVD